MQRNENVKLIVLDVDDTLISSETLGQSQRPILFPLSTKKILELAKNDPNVRIVIASLATPASVIRASLGVIANHRNIEIYGRDEVSSEPEMKFSVVARVVADNNINPRNVYWVDDSIDGIRKAQELGYNPILVPVYTTDTGQTRFAHTSYLDCVPFLLTHEHQNLIDNLRRIIKEIKNQDEASAKQLAENYTNFISTHLHPSTEAEDIKKTITAIISAVMRDVKGTNPASITPEQITPVLQNILASLIQGQMCYKEEQKTAIKRFINAIPKDKREGSELQKLSQEIQRLLGTPVGISGHLQVALVSSVVNPQTGADPLSRISYNKSYVYRRESGKPFPTLNKTNGQRNLAREFSAGDPDKQVHGGFKIQGKHIKKEDFNLKHTGSMQTAEYREHIEKSYLPEVTQDADLIEWARYNAHIGGPIAICIDNFQKVFKDKENISFMIDAEGSSFNIYTNPGENNVVYFTARVPFHQALIEDPKNQDNIVKVGGEPSRYPDQAQRGVVDPVAIYEITIRAVKTPQGVQTRLVEENFACYHQRLSPAFDNLNRHIEQRRFLDHFMDEVRTNINNFVSSADQSGSRGLLFTSSNNEGAEIINNIKMEFTKILKAMGEKPDSLDYEVTSRDLLNFLIAQKYQYLANPATANGIQLLNVLDRIIDNRSVQFSNRTLLISRPRQGIF